MTDTEKKEIKSALSSVYLPRSSKKNSAYQQTKSRLVTQ